MTDFNTIRQFNFPTTIYRDIIHFNDEGEKILFEKLKDSILP